MTVQPECMCDCFSHFQAHGCRRTAVILTRNKNAWTNTSSSLSVILWQHQCTHTHLFLCKSAENENILKSKHKHTHTFNSNHNKKYLERKNYKSRLNHLPGEVTRHGIFPCCHFPFIWSKVHSWRHYWSMI